MEDAYPKAYREVYEIIKVLPKEDVEKIPNEIIEMYKEKMDKEYDFSIDINKEFEEYNISDITKALLYNLYVDYWTTQDQRNRIINRQNYEERLLEMKKREKYNPDDLFKNKKTTEIIEDNKNLPVEMKQKNLFIKIIESIKKFFNIK